MYEIPIAGDVERVINASTLESLLDKLPENRSLINADLVELISSFPDSIDTLRSLVGISDKRMYLDLSYLFYKTPSSQIEGKNVLGSSFYDLNRHPLDFFKSKIARSEIKEQAICIVSDYLLSQGVLNVVQCLRSIGVENSLLLIDRLINEKEAQQKLTKRRGHGAEQSLAVFIKSLPVCFEPSNKDTNPMARDPNVDKSSFSIQPAKSKDTWAFDLIIKGHSDPSPRIFIQSLIHTSDPGQYGVNKSDETVLVKQSIDQANDLDGFNRELWGLLDGVGFSENKSNTIDKMLGEFNQFIQLKTLYKTALRLHAIGLIKVKEVLYSDFYSESEAKQMHEKYADQGINFAYNCERTSGHLAGGAASILL